MCCPLARTTMRPFQVPAHLPAGTLARTRSPVAYPKCCLTRDRRSLGKPERSGVVRAGVGAASGGFHDQNGGGYSDDPAAVLAIQVPDSNRSRSLPSPSHSGRFGVTPTGSDAMPAGLPSPMFPVGAPRGGGVSVSRFVLAPEGVCSHGFQSGLLRKHGPVGLLACGKRSHRRAPSFDLVVLMTWAGHSACPCDGASSVIDRGASNPSCSPPTLAITRLLKSWITRRQPSVRVFGRVSDSEHRARSPHFAGNDFVQLLGSACGLRHVRVE